jgi:hypothetical protein
VRRPLLDSLSTAYHMRDVKNRSARNAYPVIFTLRRMGKV